MLKDEVYVQHLITVHVPVDGLALDVQMVIREHTQLINYCAIQILMNVKLMVCVGKQFVRTHQVVMNVIVEKAMSLVQITKHVLVSDYMSCLSRTHMISMSSFCNHNTLLILAMYFQTLMNVQLVHMSATVMTTVIIMREAMCAHVLLVIY